MLQNLGSKGMKTKNTVGRNALHQVQLHHEACFLQVLEVCFKATAKITKVSEPPKAEKLTFT
jgi:hypothetical protein